ncbi:hypothetical protein L1887_01297 [Cichorium endivia]|nr:hypothetical protein L1887_01297 [Cichorium endivia]
MGVCNDGVKLSGTKHAIDLKGPQKISGKIETNGKDVNGLKANGKRFKAGDSAPAHANKEVYASIFTSSRKSEFKETYSCRSLPLGFGVFQFIDDAIKASMVNSSPIVLAPRLSKWLNCALSNEPLKHPIVVDYLGNLFNKQALVEALLTKKLPKAFSHIKGLKDMIAVELASIPGSDSPSGGDVKFQCPITGLEFNGKYKFYALKTCGHVLSSKALKEVKSSTCHVCHKEFLESDKIVINGNEEEVIALREKMEIEKMKLREKKVKKVKNGEMGVCNDGVKLSGTKHAIDLKGPQKISGKIETNGKDVNGLKANGKRFKAGDSAPAHANKEVYASIFTSSRKSEFKVTYSCRSLPLGKN